MRRKYRRLCCLIQPASSEEIPEFAKRDPNLEQAEFVKRQ